MRVLHLIKFLFQVREALSLSLELNSPLPDFLRFTLELDQKERFV